MNIRSLSRGDIVLVLYPYSDLTTVKQRPALVVQETQLNTGLNQLILALITSNLNRAGPTYRLLITRRDPLYAESGLRSDSVILADHLTTIDGSIISRKIGRLRDMPVIDMALKQTLGLH